MSPADPGLDVTFDSTLRRSAAQGGWTYAVLPDSVERFGTRGRVKVAGVVDGVEFEAAFLAVGDGTHILPLKASLRKAIGKETGDTVTIHLVARLS